MIKVIPLNLKKDSNTIDTSSYSHIDLMDKNNLVQIEKYVLPIIAKNEGWGTGNVTLEGFRKDPLQYQEALDASLFANVHIALDSDDNPLGLIEYLKETLDNPLSNERMNNLQEMITDRSKWDTLIKINIVSKVVVDKFFPNLQDYLANKKLYSEIGIVVRADLQGQKTGVAEHLYKLLSNGVLFAWTNNALLIAQWRKYFKSLLYYPLLDEDIDTLEALVSLAILYSDLLTYEKSKWVGLKFGALNSPYFVSSRDDFYLELAKNLAVKGKITKLDEERIKYFIERESVQGAVFAFS